MAVLQVTRSQVLRHRAKTQGLVGATDVGVLTPTVVDLGVQDTGPDGALWALALRGAPVTASPWPEELALAWTVRGAPHAYRRSELSEVAAAVRPWSHADAAKRVYDAAKPLRDASIPVGVALATVATAMRDLVTGPTAKGDVSGGSRPSCPSRTSSSAASVACSTRSRCRSGSPRCSPGSSSRREPLPRCSLPSRTGRPTTSTPWPTCR